jgi:hypothetical protein
MTNIAMTHVAVLVAATSLGAMLFFSIVVAPMVFNTLPIDHAGAFLRALFPVYFLLNGLVAALAAAFAGGGSPAVLFLLAAALMIAVRFGAIPIINSARDGMLTGDVAAKQRFHRWHGATVVVNIVEMCLLCLAIALLLGSTR